MLPSTVITFELFLCFSASIATRININVIALIILADVSKPLPNHKKEIVLRKLRNVLVNPIQY